MNHAIRDDKGLTPKQRRFVDALLANGGNRTEAAKTAGFGVKSAHVTGSRLARHPKVRALLIEHTEQVIADAAPHAAQRLRALIDHKSGYIALEAIKDVLNRAGHVPKGTSQINNGLVVNIRIGDGDQPTVIEPGV